MASVMISATIMVLYTGFLFVLGGGETIEAVIPAEFGEDEAPFTGGGVFGFFSDLVDITIGLIKLTWNIVALLISVITFDLTQFGLPDPGLLLRFLLSIPITLMTIHILWNVTAMIRGVAA